jgi:3-oxoadipate enol-lactonase
MKVSIGDHQINYEVEGLEGAPWVTLSHALGNNLSLWDGQVDLLKDRFRILRYDHRGHGGSSAPPGPYSFNNLMVDAVALLDHLNIDKTHWVGLSIGGMLGYGMAQNYGDRLLSLTACDSRPDAPEDYAAYFQYRIDTAREKGMEGVVEPTIKRWFTPETVDTNPPYLDKVRNMLRSTNPIGHEGCCEALKQLAFRRGLGDISVPTLLIGGAQDKGAPPEILAEAAAAIPDCRHVIVDRAGHIANIENPEAVNTALSEFLIEQTVAA